MNEGLVALLDVLYYNGYKEVIYELISYIESNEDVYGISQPNFLGNDYDDPLRILWSVLVMLYGDYGTSPRTGWIEKDRKKECLNALKAWQDTFPNLNDDDEEIPFT